MITISVITPTYKREEDLAHCVKCVLAQEVDAQIEHIIVNDAGEPLRPAPWMEDKRVRVVNTYRTERSVARNTGAALSTGQWLYFLDDDDYPLPGAFAALLALAKENPDAVHIYGGYEIFNEETKVTEQLQPDHQGNVFPIMFSGEMFPMQATWFRRDAFFKTRGFDPLFVPVEDADLVQSICRLGVSAGTKAIVAHVRVNHQATSTTSLTRATTLSRMTPERWSLLPDTLPLLQEVTRKDHYWAGRSTRTYLVATIRSLQKGSVTTATSRAVQGMRLSGPHLFSPAFWKGLRGRSR